jgi:hypothetical protein
MSNNFGQSGGIGSFHYYSFKMKNEVLIKVICAWPPTLMGLVLNWQLSVRCEMNDVFIKHDRPAQALLILNVEHLLWNRYYRGDVTHSSLSGQQGLLSHQHNSKNNLM